MYRKSREQPEERKKCQQLGYYTLWMREPANAIETCILEDRHLKCALNVDFQRLPHSMCACVHCFFSVCNAWMCVSMAFWVKDGRAKAQ